MADMTKEEAVRQINEVTRTAAEMSRRVGELENKVGTLSADLMTAYRALNERPVVQAAMVGSDEAQLRQYVADESKGWRGIQMRTTVDEDDGEVVRGLLDDPNPTCQWQADLQKLVEQRSWLALAGKPKNGDTKFGPTSRADKALKRHIERAPDVIKRSFVDVAGSGGEWHPDLLLPQLERSLEMPGVVEGLFQQVQASGKDQIIPLLTVGARPYKKTAASGDNPANYAQSSLTTSSRTISIPAMAVRLQVDEDASQDSIINAIPLLQMEASKAIDDGFEDCAINGSTAATHEDTGLSGWDIRGRWGTAGLGGSDDHRRTFDGLRKQATARSNTTDGGAAQTFAGFMASRLTLTSPHSVLGDLVTIMSPEYYLLKVVQFTEHLTVDKFGPNAFNVTGFVAAIGGVPIFLSSYVDKQYNASGVYDNSTKTKTGFIIVDRSRYKVWRLKANTVESAKEIRNGTIDIVCTTRRLLQTFDPTGTKNVNWTYNLSTS
jgi:hypothetical protein